MSLDIIIDTREHTLIEALESDFLSKECQHLFYDVKPLEIGDILIQSGDQKICLIERKTLQDYASSIVDKRLKNQLIRLHQVKQESPETLIIYLVEGLIAKDHIFYNGITRDAIYTSMIHRMIEDHFFVYRTKDIYDTALVITKLYDQLARNVGKDYPNRSLNNINYLKTIQLNKKDNMTPFNCYLCQLSQIPGVSIDIANVIAQIYPSMVDLVHAYDTCNVPEMMLSQLVIPMANQKSRHLGSVLSQRIYHHTVLKEKKKLILKSKIDK